MTSNWGGLNIGYTQDSAPEISNSQVSKVIPDWVFELKSGWGQGAAPETVDPFLEKIDASEIENGTCIVTVNLAQFNAINGHEGCRLKEISVLSGCEINESVDEEEVDSCEKNIKIMCQGEHSERSIKNACWLMDVCINVYVELPTAIIPIKAGTPLEQVVTSEAYGLPPTANEELEEKTPELKGQTPQQKYSYKQRKILEGQLKQMQEMQQQMGMGGMGMQMSMNFGNQPQMQPQQNQGYGHGYANHYQHNSGGYRGRGRRNYHNNW